MFGGLLKLTFSFNVLLLFIILLWQTATANALPMPFTNDDSVELYDMSNFLLDTNRRDAPVDQRSLLFSVEQPTLTDNSHIRSRLRSRRLRKKLQSSKRKSLPTHFQAIGLEKENLPGSREIQSVLDNRLKRFRMLEPDEFQEMLNSLHQQTPDELSKTLNNMDTIGGIKLENYWSL